MARTAPTVILSHNTGSTVHEICSADAVYAVLYKGLPVKLRHHNPLMAYLGFKYSKTSFPESGHAIRLAVKLNQIHNTEDFTVSIMTPSRAIKLQP